MGAGPNRGQTMFLPRLPLEVDGGDSGLGFSFRRLQFPVKVAFCLTINRSQGQTKQKVGVYLPTPVHPLQPIAPAWNTGAQVSVLPSAQLPVGVALAPSSTQLSAANGSSIATHGCLERTVQLGSCSFPWPWVIPWVIFEWQHRGSVHAHGLLWMDDCPVSQAEELLSAEGRDEEKRELLSYYSAPKTSAATSRRHPTTRSCPAPPSPHHTFRYLSDRSCLLYEDANLDTMTGTPSAEGDTGSDQPAIYRRPERPAPASACPGL